MKEHLDNLFGFKPTVDKHSTLAVMETMSYMRDKSRDEAHFVQRFSKLSAPKKKGGG